MLLSSGLGEAHHFSDFSEAATGNVQIVFADESVVVTSVSTGSAIAAVLAGVGPPLKVGHLW